MVALGLLSAMTDLVAAEGRAKFALATMNRVLKYPLIRGRKRPPPGNPSGFG
jgi:hypothetical protein